MWDTNSFVFIVAMCSYSEISTCGRPQPWRLGLGLVVLASLGLRVLALASTFWPRLISLLTIITNTKDDNNVCNSCIINNSTFIICKNTATSEWNQWRNYLLSTGITPTSALVMSHLPCGKELCITYKIQLSFNLPIFPQVTSCPPPVSQRRSLGTAGVRLYFWPNNLPSYDNW